MTAHAKGLKGTKLVVDEDGCLIDEDDILNFVSGKDLLLMDQNDDWISHHLIASIGPQNSTNTVIDESYYIINSPLGNISDDSTLSMSSSVLSSPSSRSDSTNYISTATKRSFDHFKIPWDKFPSSIIETCENKLKLDSQLKTVLHTIVDELRTISVYIPIAVFRDVADSLSKRYPCTFLYTDNAGTTLSIRNSPIITTLVQRNNYLNRQNSNKNKNSIPLKKKKISKNFEDTCKNWQPEISNQDDIDSIKSKLLELHHRRTFSSQEHEEIQNMMAKTYPAQRSFLNNLANIPSVQSIKENLPFLLSKIHILNHFTL